MARIEIDDAFFPILVQRMPGVIEDADVEGMMAFYDRYLVRERGRHAIVIDCAPDHRGLNAVQRKRVAEWQQGLHEKYGEPSVCTAVVLRSALVRGAMTAYNWISPPRTPMKLVASVAEGFEFCIQSLERAGIPIPAEVRREHERLVASSR